MTDIVDQWRGVFASAETPPEQIKALSDACVKVESDPKFSQFRENTLELEGGVMPAEEFDAFVKAEYDKMKKLGTEYGVYK